MPLACTFSVHMVRISPDGQPTDLKRGCVTARTCLQFGGIQSDRDGRRQGRKDALHCTGQATLPPRADDRSPPGGV